MAYREDDPFLAIRGGMNIPGAEEPEILKEDDYTFGVPEVPMASPERMDPQALAGVGDFITREPEEPMTPQLTPPDDGMPRVLPGAGRVRRALNELREFDGGLTDQSEQLGQMLDVDPETFRRPFREMEAVTKQRAQQLRQYEDRLGESVNREQVIADRRQKLEDEWTSKEQRLGWIQNNFARSRGELSDLMNRAEEGDATAIQELNKGTEFNPFRGTAGKIISAAAVGLGAYASGILRSPNAAMQVINQRTEQELQRQKAMYQKGRGEKLEARNLYSKMMNELGNREQAERATRNGIMNEMRIAAEQLRGRVQDAKAQAALGQTIMGLQNQIADSQARLKQDRLKSSVQGELSLLKTKAAMMQPTVRTAGKYIGEADIPEWMQQLPGKRTDKAAWRKAQEKLVAPFAGLQTWLDEAIELRKELELGTQIAPGRLSEMKGRLETAGAMLYLGQKEAANLGAALTAIEESILKGVVPKNLARLGFTLDKLSNLKEKSRLEMHNKLGVYGLGIRGVGQQKQAPRFGRRID